MRVVRKEPGTYSKRFIGVKQDGPLAWVGFVYAANGYPVRLGVWGFEIDAAVARNYFVAHFGEDYCNSKYNVIPAAEMFHD